MFCSRLLFLSVRTSTIDPTSPPIPPPLSHPPRLLPLSPAVMSLGHLAASSPDAALAIVVSEGLLPLRNLLGDCDEDEAVRAACAWAISQIGVHRCGLGRFCVYLCMDASISSVSLLNFLPAERA